MKLRKALRTMFHRKYILLNRVLLDEGIAFNWEPIFEAAGHLSNKRQRKLGKLIANYIHGWTVTVHNEYAFMNHAVQAFENAELCDDLIQEKFEDEMRK